MSWSTIIRIIAHVISVAIVVAPSFNMPWLVRILAALGAIATELMQAQHAREKREAGERLGRHTTPRAFARPCDHPHHKR